MSSIGFPDGQRITQWVGAPIVQAAALAIGNVLHTDGPFNLASWASVVVAIKPTGGNVTVTVRQQINGGPPGLTLPTTFVVPAGATLFESVVLFGDSVSVDLTGSAVGVTVDYAVYPSNTTTNAQVLASATINIQKNDVLVASEPTLDFEDANGMVWTLTDDAPNTRMKVFPPRQGTRQVGLLSVVNTAAQVFLAVLTLPAGAMGASGIVHVRLVGAYLNATGAPQNFNLELDFGGGFGWSDTFPVAMESAALWRPFVLDMTIANLGVTNSQFIAGTVDIGDYNGAPANGWGNGARPQNDANVFGRTFAFSSAGPVAIDTTLAQTIGIVAQHGVASPSLEIRRYAAIAEVL